MQPEGSFRFNLDALLLAAFTLHSLPASQPSEPSATLTTTPPPHLRLVELGTGCGVVLCALALRNHHLQGIGIEKEAALVAAAQSNIARLGLTERLHVCSGDVTTPETVHSLGENSYEYAVTNPPYRLSHAGRPSPHQLRQTALTGDDTTLDGFCATAYRLLRHGGRLYGCFLPENLPRLSRTLEAQHFGLRRILLVHPHAEKKASLLFFEARKNAASDLCIDPPLFLYHSGTTQQRKEYAPQAKAFCPWL